MAPTSQNIHPTTTASNLANPKLAHTRRVWYPSYHRLSFTRVHHFHLTTGVQKWWKKFGCRSLKFYFGHQHSHHSTWVPLFLWMEYFHHHCGKPSYRGNCMHYDIGWVKCFTGTAVWVLFGGTIHTQGIL